MLVSKNKMIRFMLRQSASVHCSQESAYHPTDAEY
jgi:hypothetical protein